jgi:PAS domain S-box-containing protein
MMADFLKSQLDYIFFVYGAAFFLLIPLCLFLRQRPNCCRLAWVWLGWFGATHGTNEWLDLLALSLDANPLFDLARICLLIVSFVCLAQFGRVSLATMRGHGPGRWVLAVLVALGALGGLAGLSGLNAAARYGLGFVGGLWAAWALFFAAKTLPLGARQLQAAALGIALYALSAGLVPNPAPFFPASWLNYEYFLVLTAVPIQLIRCVLAVWISVSLCLLARSSLEVEKDLRQRAWFGNLMRGAIISLTLLVIGGWLITQYFGDIATRAKRDDYEQVVEVLSQTMRQKVSELERFVTLISEWPTTLPALASGTPKAIDQANFGLDFFCQKIQESVCYLMNLNGQTIASSNRHLPDSFVGQSYFFRPYFQQAVQGVPGNYFALGVTSKKLGFYASFPVRDQAGKIEGVAVIKRPMDEIETLIHEHYVGLVIDRQGIVVMSNRSDMLLKSLWPLTSKVREELIASRQFGDGPFIPIMDQEPVDGGRYLLQGKPMMALRRPVPWEDWSIVIFDSVWPISQARLLGISIALLLDLAMVAFFAVVVIMREGEEHFRHLFENAADSLVLHDQGRVIEVNQQACRSLGYTREELLRMSLFDIEVGYNKMFLLDRWENEMDLSIFSGLHRRKDGSTFPAEVRVGKVTLRGQELRLAAIRDITERKQAMEALVESEKRFRDVAENAHEWVWEVDAEGKYTYTSPIVERLLGYRPEEILDKHFYDLFIPEEREKFKELALATFADKQLFRDFINWNLHKDGSIVCLSTSAVPILDKSGNLLGYRGADIDITERKKTEEALGAERQRLYNLLDGLQAYIYLRRSNHSLVYVNKYFRESFGDPGSLPCFTILHNRHKACEGCPSEKVFETGTPQEWERTSSSGRIYRIYDYPFADVDGTPLVLEMGLDITQHKQAEAGLRASEEALRQSQERYQMLAGHLLTAQEAERKRLARELHDDLSQRLAALAMEAEAFERQKFLLSEAGQVRLKEMKDKLVELSIDVHAMSRRLHPSILDDLGLADAVESECAMFRKRDGIVVNYQTENIRREVPPNIAVCLYRIVQEALRNISRHAEATEVAITLVGEDQAIRLSIRDNGKGFDPGQKTSKVGLGLDSMKERANLIGGDFSAKSQPGQGTVIEVLAPLSRRVA